MYQANVVLQTTPLSSLTSVQLENIIGGVGPSLIQNVTDADKVTVITTILTASVSSVTGIILPQVYKQPKISMEQ